MVEGPCRARSHGRQQGVPYRLLLLSAGASEWSEDCFTIWNAGESGEAETDTAGPVGSIELGSCVELLEGVGWATVVVAPGASAEPVPAAVGAAKTEGNSLSAAREASPRSG